MASPLNRLLLSFDFLSNVGLDLFLLLSVARSHFLLKLFELFLYSGIDLILDFYHMALPVAL